MPDPSWPVPDNSDVASSVSLNTSMLQDLYPNEMDSISQISGNRTNENAGPPMDLQNVAAEIGKRDQKIKDLLSDRKKLKGLLQKAKVAIDSINGKFKQAEEAKKQANQKIGEVMQQNKDLVQTLEIVQKQRTGIERSDVKDILCRLKCNDVGYTLIQNKSGDCVWFQDSLIINI